MADLESVPLHRPPPPPFFTSSPRGMNMQRSTSRVNTFEFPTDQQLLESEHEYDEEKEEEKEEKNEEKEGGKEDAEEENEREKWDSTRSMVWCAWSLLGILCFGILGLIIWLLFVATLRLGLPEVRMLRLHFSRLDVNFDTSTVITNMEFHIQIRNENMNTRLLYSNLTIDVSSEDIQLVTTTISGFAQHPHNVTVLNLNMNGRSSGVNENNAVDLKSNVRNNVTLVDFMFSGTIGFHLGAIHINEVPLLILCQNMQQNQLYRRDKNKCSVKIYSSLPFF